MITLTLLHPLQSVAVQTWTFAPTSPIRIGRSRNNEVTLYSAVVSRHHVELRPQNDLEWELINLGSNGTFAQGKRINRTTVANGMIIRLAASGPQIQIWTQPPVDANGQPKPLPGVRSTPSRERSVLPGQSKISREDLERAKETKLE